MDKFIVTDTTIDLEYKARQLEKWLLENTQHPEFMNKVHEWNNILFRITSSREFANNLERGTFSPKTYNMPRRIYKNEDVKR